MNKNRVSPDLDLSIIMVQSDMSLTKAERNMRKANRKFLPLMLIPGVFALYFFPGILGYLAIAACGLGAVVLYIRGAYKDYKAQKNEQTIDGIANSEINSMKNGEDKSKSKGFEFDNATFKVERLEDSMELPKMKRPDYYYTVEAKERFKDEIRSAPTISKSSVDIGALRSLGPTEDPLLDNLETVNGYTDYFLEYAANKQKHGNIGKTLVESSDTLTKEETMEQIFKEIDIYYTMYRLSPMEVKESEWNCLFDNLYNFFVEKGMQDKFYVSMNAYIQFCLAETLVRNRKVNINAFVDGLRYMKISKMSESEFRKVSDNIVKDLSEGQQYRAMV